MRTWVSVLALVVALGGPSTSTLAQTNPPLTAVDWPQPNFDYSNHRDATSSVISSNNISQLSLSWTFSVNCASAFGALASTPVVVNGSVFLQDLKSNVYVIDLNTGALKWQKLYNADSVGPNGPAVDSGKVFVASNERTVAALDASTGNELWSVQIAPPDTQSTLVQTAIQSGPEDVQTVQFTAPAQPGSYFFRCDVHPTIMTGHLIPVAA
jgi:glucose dehydrogenase